LNKFDRALIVFSSFPSFLPSFLPFAHIAVFDPVPRLDSLGKTFREILQLQDQNEKEELYCIAFKKLFDILTRDKKPFGLVKSYVYELAEPAELYRKAIHILVQGLVSGKYQFISFAFIIIQRDINDTNNF